MGRDFVGKTLRASGDPTTQLWHTHLIDWESARKLYDGGTSRAEVGRTFGCRPDTVKRYLLSMGARVRTEEEQHALDMTQGTGGHVKVDESFFDSWTPQMAYVLGWIASDGCLSGTGVSITSTDLDHLENLRQLLGSTGKMTTYGGGVKRKVGGKIHVHRERVVKRLLELGITPRKARTIRMPQVPDEMFGHFFRGVFEGDGTVFVREGKRMGVMTVAIYSASRGFLEDMNEAIVRATGVKPGGLYHVDAWDMNELTFGGYDRCQALYHLMYGDVPEVMRLDRKWRKMHDYFARGGAKLAV